MVSEGRKPAWMLAFGRRASHFTVTSTVKKRALLLAREMDSVCGAATPAHQSSTIAEVCNSISAIFGPSFRTLEVLRPRLADGLIGQRAGPLGAVRSLLSNTNLRGVGDPGHWFTAPRCVALSDGQQTSVFVQRASEMRCTTSVSSSWASFSRITCAE